MKKLFFTAIALVAFSGVSMASSIEVSNEMAEIDCALVALAAFDVADADGSMTMQQGADFMNDMRAACEKSKKQMSTKK